MADSAQNRTEQATPKRKADARGKGQIALSRDAVMAVGLLGSMGALYWLAPVIVERLRWTLQVWLSQSMEESAHRALSLDHLHVLLRQIGLDVFVTLAPVVGSIAVIGIGANLMQTGFLWKREGIDWDISRISPMGGFKRLFSVRTFSELVKTWLKILAIGFTGYLAIKDDLLQFSPLTQFGMETLLPTVGWATFKAALHDGRRVAGHRRHRLWVPALRMGTRTADVTRRNQRGKPRSRRRSGDFERKSGAPRKTWPAGE